MSGIYIHIPFCKRKCHYCDFYSIDKNDKDLINQFIDALIKEIEYYSYLVLESKPTTIYIGGGTPNIIPIELLLKLLSKINEELFSKNIVEYTIECNPEFVSKEFLNLLAEKNINRISLGVQSFNNTFLRQLGRISNLDTNIQAIELIKSYSDFQLSCDMIFGIPYQTVKDLNDDINNLLIYSPKHISYYGLTLENNTELYKLIKNGTYQLPNEEISSNMYLKIHNILTNNDYSIYEISNYAKNGFQSVHNSNYWKGKVYYGFGPSATSFNSRIRYKNISSVKEYIKLINNKKSVVHYSEKLCAEQQIIEFIMLSLRTREGLTFEKFKNKFGFSFYDYVKRYYKELISNKELIKYNDEKMYLTINGFLVYDYIVGQLITNINSIHF